MREAGLSMRRLIARLQQGGELKRAGAAYLLAGKRGPKTVVPAEIVAALLAEGLVCENADAVVVTAAGERWLKQASPRELEARLVKDPDGYEHYVVVNAAESPLALLAHRGQIGAVAYEAGDKLRRDYTIGQLTARMGVDFSAPVGRRTFAPDLADTVVAARQRFNQALRAVGPGLADVLFDICCYLTSLEACEQIRHWPRGSARVVLALALDRLASHYGMAPPQSALSRVWRSEG